MTKVEVVKLRTGDKVVMEVPLFEEFLPLITRVVKDVQRGRRPGVVQVTFACGHVHSFSQSALVQILAKSLAIGVVQRRTQMRPHMKAMKLLTVALLSLTAFGCGTQEIPPAHKGRMFDKTGALALYSGGKGFEGPILGPGTHQTYMYPEIFMVDCSQVKYDQKMQALTKDGVQFTLELNISFSANCEETAAIESLLTKLTPAPAKEGQPRNLTIFPSQIYNTYMHPSLGEAVRVAVSPHIANDINAKREEIFGKVKETFGVAMEAQKPKLIQNYSLNLSNLDFPDAMDKANEERATQAILKDKAIAEREKVLAEIETAKLSVKRETADAEAQAAKIDIIGAALHRNPEYYVRDVYWYAADKGGSVMIPSDPRVILNITPKAPSAPKKP